MFYYGHFPALPRGDGNGRFTSESSRNSDKAALTLCASTGNGQMHHSVEH
jgi:hypothetical protein